MEENCTIIREPQKLTLKFSQPCCVDSIVFDLSPPGLYAFCFQMTHPDETAQEETMYALHSETAPLEDIIARLSKKTSLCPIATLEDAWELLGTLQKKGRISVRDDTLAEIFAHLNNMGLKYDLPSYNKGDRALIQKADMVDDELERQGIPSNSLASHIPGGIRKAAEIKVIALDQKYERPSGKPYAGRQ